MTIDVTASARMDELLGSNAQQRQHGDGQRAQRQGSKQGHRQGSKQGQRQGSKQGHRQGSKQGQRQGSKEGQRPEKKLVRCVHSKHVLARAGFLFQQASKRASSPSRPAGLATPLLQSTCADPTKSPSTQTIGVGITPEEAEGMYALSTDAETIERFISHSWSAPRLSKWLALCDVYNRNFALGCAAAWWLAATSIGISLRLQTGQLQSWACSLAVYLFAPALVFACAFVQGLDALGSTCFFDKLCVHQTDPDLKLAGIRRLGDCLRASQNLTILWCDDYFSRLWCVLEVAVFVRNFPDVDAAVTRITLEPLWLPPFLFWLLVCNVLVAMGSAALEQSALFASLIAALGPEMGIGVFWVIANMAPALMICWILRRKSDKAAATLSRLASFRLSEVQVTVEDDRRIVYEQIEAMFGSTERFEEYMRTKFHDAAVRLVGEPSRIRYVWAVIVFQPCLWYATVDFCIADQGEFAEMSGVSVVAYMAVEFLYYVAFAVVVNPLVLEAVSLGQRASRALAAGPALLLDLLVYQSANFLLNAGLMWLTLRLTAVLAEDAF